MRVYLLVYILTIIICFAYPKVKEKNYKWKLVTVFFPLFLFGALRVNFGRDDYDEMFEVFHNQLVFAFDHDAHSELGFQLLCYIIPDFRLMLIFTAVLMCIGLIAFFNHFVPQKSLPIAISLLFLTGNFTIYFILASLRGGIAISLFLLSTPLIEKRKLLPFAIITLIASQFHTSALFNFPLAYLIGRTTGFSRRELMIWIGFIMFFATSTTTGLIRLIQPVVNEYFDRYDTYIELGLEHGNTSHILGTTGSIILFALLCFFAGKTPPSSKTDLSVLRVAFLYSMALIMTSLNVRISHFTSLYIVAATAFIYSKMPMSDIKRFYLIYVFAYVGYSFYLWTQGTWFTHHLYHSLLGTF